MDIDLVFKIAAVGIVVAVLNQLLVRSDRPDQAMLVSLAGLITTMMLLVREISSLFDLIKSLLGFRMELLIKLAALSLCVSAVTALLKKSDEALSLLLLLAAVLVGCALLLPALSELFDFCERALSLTDLPLTLFVPVVKVTAIALVARFSCALCADAGQSALSSLLAAAGTLCALVCALPLMEALLEMVEGFL